jgi:glycerol uptake facilitator-like aquaporin
VCALGATAGTYIAGPIGAAIGGTAGGLLSPAFDVGLNLLDTYVLGSIFKGWNPRYFFTKEIQNIVNKKNI